MRSSLSLPLLPGPLRPVVVATDRVLSMGQIELFDIQTVYLRSIKLFEIQLFSDITMCKQKTVYLCENELFEIELFDHLTVSK